MAVTEVRDVEKVSWAKRLGGSLKGVLAGIVLFIAGFPVLFWNESRSVATAKRLDEGAGAVVSVPADKVEAANEGKLVHVSGRAATDETLADAQFGVSANAIRLARKVEVYQWVEHSDTKRVKEGDKEKDVTTYSYTQEWCEKPVDSGRFHDRGFVNPPAALPFSDREVLASKVALGAFTLSAADVKRISGEVPFEFPVDYKVPETIAGGQFLNGTVYIPAAEVVPAPAVPAPAVSAPAAPAPAATPAATNAVAEVAAAATNAVAQAVAQAAPARAVAQQPKTGDIRVTFTVVPQHDISVVERQTGSTLAPWTASDGKDISMLVNGLRTAEQMFASAKSANKTFTWIIRLIGFLLMFAGVKMVLGPFVTLVDVIPILNGLVAMGVSLVAFLVAAAFSLLTIAVSWIAVRPVLGVTLLVAAGALIAWLAVRKRQAEQAK